MLIKKRSTGFVYLDKDRFYFYGSNYISNLIRFVFPPDAVRDLEILNQELFENQIVSFITTNKIVPANLIIILSPSVLFEKDFPAAALEQQDTEIESFLENVPFDNIGSKKIVVNKVTKIVATNKDMYQSIKNAFETKGFTVDAITPLFSLKENVTISNELDLATAKIILKKYDSLKEDSFAESDISISDNQEYAANSGTISTVKKFRTIILVATFCVLLAALGIILYLQGKSSDTPTAHTPAAASTIKPTSAPTPTIVATPTTVISATPSASLQNNEQAKASSSASIKAK